MTTHPLQQLLDNATQDAMNDGQGFVRAIYQEDFKGAVAWAKRMLAMAEKAEEYHAAIQKDQKP